MSGALVKRSLIEALPGGPEISRDLVQRRLIGVLSGRGLVKRSCKELL